MILLSKLFVNNQITHKTLYTKYQKLSHKIKSSIKTFSDLTDRILKDFITDYDDIRNDNEYGYLSAFKKSH